MSPRVTVVIPIYNVEKYLKKCLDSVKNQTLKDIEVIIVNDASTDKSVDIAREYVKNDSRFTLLDFQDNHGQSYVRNRGMEAANGEYVQFLDSDDWLDAEALENLEATMRGNDLDIILYDRKTIYESNELKRVYSYSRRKYQYLNVLSGLQMFSLQVQQGDYRTSAAAVMYRKNFLSENKISFYEEIIHEDELYCFHTLLLANRVMCLPDTFYNRLVRKSSTMTVKKSIKNLKGYCIGYCEMYKIFIKLKLNKSVYRKVIQKFLDNFIMYIRNIKKEITNTSDFSNVTFSEPSHAIFFNTLCSIEDSEETGLKFQRYIFPYHMFHRNEKCLLYGAGNVGKELYFQALHDKYVQLIGIVDKNAKKIQSKLPVKEISLIREVEFDSILIAIENGDIAKEVFQTLVDMGVDEKRIKWCGELYQRRFWYEDYYFPMLDRIF